MPWSEIANSLVVGNLPRMRENQGIRTYDVIYSILWIILYILHTISLLRLLSLLPFC
jgi:hypothetical protein